jgi:hypothetical protein
VPAILGQIAQHFAATLLNKLRMPISSAMNKTSPPLFND